MSPQDRYTVDGLDTYASFIDVDDVAAPVEALPELDRSTLESFSRCPAAARIRDLKLVPDSSDAANSGNEVHAVMSNALSEWIATQGWIGGEQGAKQVGYLADWIRGQAMMARPDVQPDVVEALRGSAWTLAEFIDSIHPNNIIRYDGGAGQRRGQLGWNVPHLGRCLTSELDLLLSTASVEVFDEIDWKSGQKRNWTAAEVRHSFQFGMHAWLVFKNYEQVNTLNVTIWPLRNVGSRCAVQFFRKDLPALENRIFQAAEYWRGYHAAELSAVPCWPSKEKCRLCDGRVFCPIRPPSACADDPAAFVGAMVAVEAKLDGMREEAIDYVRLTGADIVTPDGDAFGFSKPARTKPKAALYSALGAQPTNATGDKRERTTRERKPRKERAVAADVSMDEVFASLNAKDQLQAQ